MRSFGLAVLALSALNVSALQIWVSSASDRDNPFGTDELVWSSALGCIGEAANCTAVGAEAIAEDLREVVDATGEELGIRRRTPSGREYRLVRVIVVPPPEDEDAGGVGRYGEYHGGHLRTIVRPEDWADRDGVVHHEAAHDFFEEHMTDIATVMGNAETGALNEGIAQVVEQEIGGANVPAPPHENWRVSLANHGIHAAGRHIVEAFEDFAEATSAADALDLFLEAIREFEDVDGDGRAEFAELVRAAMNEVESEERQDLIDAFLETGIVRLPRFVESVDELPANREPVSVPDRSDIDYSRFTCYWIFDEGAIVCVSNRLPHDRDNPPSPAPRI